MMNALVWQHLCFQNGWEIGCSDKTIQIINHWDLPSALCTVTQLFALSWFFQYFD